MTRILSLIAGLTLIASCQAARDFRDGRTVRQAWNGSRRPELQVSEQPSPLRAEREVPVLSAPEVFAAYVPSHVDRRRDVMIGEHWVYFKLRDGDWFAEREREAEPAVSGEAPDASLAPLRRFEDLDRAVVPWK